MKINKMLIQHIDFQIPVSKKNKSKYISTNVVGEMCLK